MSLRLRGFLGFLVDDLIIIGVHQRDPTVVIKLTPGISGTGFDLGNGHGPALADAANHGIIRTGTGSNIHIRCSDRNRYRLHPIGLLRNLYYRIILDFCVFTLDPPRIQGHIPGGLIQGGYLCAAFVGSIPARKGITLPGGDHTNRRIQIRIVGLNISLAVTAVEFKDHIAVIGGNAAAVNTVEKNVCLNQTAGDQRLQNAAAGMAPLADLKHEIIACDAVDQAGSPGSLPEHPCRAEVICKKQQRVELVLCVIQIVFINEAVNALRKIRRMGTKQRVSFFVGDSFSPVTLQILIGTAGTMSNRPLGIIPAWILVKAFHSLQQLYTLITDGKLRFCRYRHRVCGDQTQHQNNRQQK